MTISRVHRISNRLNWATTNTPEETRKELEDWIPKSYWLKVNKALVGYGQTICKAKKPKCDRCPLKNKCSYYLSINLG